MVIQTQGLLYSAPKLYVLWACVCLVRLLLHCLGCSPQRAFRQAFGVFPFLKSHIAHFLNASDAGVKWEKSERDKERVRGVEDQVPCVSQAEVLGWCGKDSWNSLRSLGNPIHLFLFIKHSSYLLPRRYVPAIWQHNRVTTYDRQWWNGYPWLNFPVGSLWMGL